MHATHVLDNYLMKRCQGIHQKRWQSLMRCVRALMTGKTLSVTGLGRAIQSASTQKHNIKSADRLMGNPALHQERKALYQAQSTWLLKRCRQPVIIVDWSDLTDDRRFHLLRASTPMGGRALTLYEEVHTQPYVNNRRVQTRFLKQLQQILPSQCKPIIVTDAGFRNPWFRAVERLGWDWVGRIPRNTDISTPAQQHWISIRYLYNKATRRPTYFDEIMLTARDPLRCHCYLWRRKAKGRVKTNRFSNKSLSKHSLKNAAREKGPWVLATSLTGGKTITKQVIQLYKSRMQIEEAFRDLKNQQWGYALRNCRTNMAYRFENLLLVGMLATLATWLVGKVAELKQWHRRYQANTIQHRNVLSTFYLGSEVLKDHVNSFSKHDYRQAFKLIRQTVQQEATAC